MSNASPPQTHLRKTDPRGYIQRGRETFSQEARQMLFRFMVDSREEIGQNHGASQPQPEQSPAGAPRAPTYSGSPIVEDPEYLAGFHVADSHYGPC